MEKHFGKSVLDFHADAMEYAISSLFESSSYKRRISTMEDHNKAKREEAIAKHRKMWEMLSRNPDMSKGMALESMGVLRGSITNNCFLCKYVTSIHDHLNASTCGKDCPLVWTNNRGEVLDTCESIGSPYVVWGATSDPIRRKSLAKVIQNLLVKELPKKRKIEQSKFYISKTPSGGIVLMYGPWSLIIITSEGKMIRCSSLTSDLGFDLDSMGRIKDA